jgi:orotate phosphoribosyltransferase
MSTAGQGRALVAESDIRSRVFGIIHTRSFGRRRIKLASGRESDFYFDMKPTMFDPEAAAYLPDLILDRLDGTDIQLVGGLEMGAVPLIATVSGRSFQRGRPLGGFFVRKNVKEHGTRKRIDGTDVSGKRVAILEDVTTTGGSAMQAVEAVREVGGEVVLVLSIVDRGEGAAEFYRGRGVPFDSLFTAAEFLAA